MENQSAKQGNDLKNIQQDTTETANGKPGTTLAEDTELNKKEAAKPIPQRDDDIENATDVEERTGNNGL